MATNYGLLSTAAEGIQTGLAAYQTTQKMKRDSQMQNLAYGLQQDDNGDLQYTPEKQAEVDADRKTKTLASQFQQKEYGEASDADKGLLKQHMNMVKAGSGDAADFNGLSFHDLKDQEGLLAPDVSGHYAVAAAGAKATAAGSDDTPKYIDTRLKDMDTAMDPNKGRAGLLAKTQGMSNAADRVDAILKQFPDGNIPKAQTHELATAQAAMVAGGSPQSQKQIDDVTPSSLRGNMEGIEGWLGDNPKGLQQQAFIKALADSTHREKDVAMDQLHSAQVQDLGPYTDLANKPYAKTRYQGILDKRGITPDMMDAQGRYIPSSQRQGAQGQQDANAHPQDSAAVAWAKANSKDPRSAAILKANGL